MTLKLFVHARNVLRYRIVSRQRPASDIIAISVLYYFLPAAAMLPGRMDEIKDDPLQPRQRAERAVLLRIDRVPACFAYGRLRSS